MKEFLSGGKSKHYDKGIARTVPYVVLNSLTYWKKCVRNANSANALLFLHIKGAPAMLQCSKLPLLTNSKL